MTKVTNATRYGSGASSDHDELAQFTYTFNAAGDRLSNARHRGSGGNAEGFSKMQQIDAYAYDTLHRLTTVDYNTGGVTGDEVYVYDSLGNRVTYTDQRNSITRTYANNAANEYTSVATFAVTHDPAGNLSRQVVDGSGNAYVYSYDDDNRLLKVEYDPVSSTVNTPLATFAYDALGRKITAWTQFDINAPGGDDQTKDLRFYHDGQVEVADYESDNSTLARRFINGTQYIDERAVLIEGPAASADTYYYLLQELYTVTGLIEKNGALAEANVYDGYGKVTIWDYSPGDFDRDGDVDTTDQISFNAAKPVGGTGSGVPAKDPMADLDMDGDVDNADSTAFTTIKNAGGAVTEAFVSSIGNPFFFTGRRLYFLETLPEISATAVANQQIQHNGTRHYLPNDGIWLQRDRLQYENGLDLYEYVGARPNGWVDPAGTFAIEITGLLHEIACGVGCCKPGSGKKSFETTLEFRPSELINKIPFVGRISGRLFGKWLGKIAAELKVEGSCQSACCGKTFSHITIDQSEPEIEGGISAKFGLIKDLSTKDILDLMDDLMGIELDHDDPWLNMGGGASATVGGGGTARFEPCSNHWDGKVCLKAEAEAHANVKAGRRVAGVAKLFGYCEFCWTAREGWKTPTCKGCYEYQMTVNIWKGWKGQWESKECLPRD